MNRLPETSHGSAVSSRWLILSFERKTIQLLDAPALLKAAKNILGLGKIQSMPEGFPFCPGRLDKKEQGAHIFGTSVHTREQIPLPQGTSPPFPSKPSSKMTAAEGNMQQVQGEVCSPGKARLGGA